MKVGQPYHSAPHEYDFQISASKEKREKGISSQLTITSKHQSKPFRITFWSQICLKEKLKIKLLINGLQFSIHTLVIPPRQTDNVGI